MTSLTSLIQPQQPPVQQSQPNPTSPESNGELDTDGNGEITPDEFFAYFDSDGDGKITMKDFAACYMFLLQNPGLLKPYMKEAFQNVNNYSESYAKLHGRLKETLLVAKDDPKGTDKIKKALTTKQDVQVIDRDKISQFKLQREHYQNLAGIVIK